MPRGDGTGPGGQGPGTGRGTGRGGEFAAGSGGSCVCPSCGKRITHQMGMPCYEQKCPDCGAIMTRE